MTRCSFARMSFLPPSSTFIVTHPVPGLSCRVSDGTSPNLPIKQTMRLWALKHCTAKKALHWATLASCSRDQRSPKPSHVSVGTTTRPRMLPFCVSERAIFARIYQEGMS